MPMAADVRKMEQFLEREWSRLYHTPAPNGNEAAFSFAKLYLSLPSCDRDIAATVLGEWLCSWGPGKFDAAFSTMHESRSSAFVPALEHALTTLDDAEEEAVESMRRLYANSEDVDATEADLRDWAASEIAARRDEIARLIEELVDPAVGADRWRLRDAFVPSLWSSRRVPREPARADLLELHAKLYDYDRLLNKAMPLLGGQDVDRSQFGPKPELKAALTALTSSPDEEVRQFAVEHLAYYEILETAHIAARDVRHI